VTTVFSLLAYIWLLVIVAVTSPGVVEIWESVITFMLFPLMVLVAFGADRGMVCGIKGFQGQKQIELEQPDGMEEGSYSCVCTCTKRMPHDRAVGNARTPYTVY
jgi:hypothetical protein